MAGYYKKRKCGVDSVYQSEGCGKTYDNNKRYNAPHLNSMGYLHATSVHSHITTQGMSAVRCPVVKKTSTFSD